MTIQECQKKAHENAVAKGFWDDSQNISEKLMLIVSELGEACEALRKNDTQTGVSQRDKEKMLELAEQGEFTLFKEMTKDSFPDELADVIIRTLDLAEFMGIDLETHVRLKMRYNEGRPRLHGKAF